MEPLHRLRKKARLQGLLGKIAKSCEAFMMSLYADNDALFSKPTEQEFLITNHILKTSEEASGLMTNLNKIEFYPIQCSNIDLGFLS
jgi:hypothetical protein